MIHYELTWNGFPWGNGWHDLDELKAEAERLMNQHGASVFTVVKVESTKTDITEEVGL